MMRARALWAGGASVIPATRTPMIKFVGKRAKLPAKPRAVAAVSAATPTVAVKAPANTAAVVPKKMGVQTGVDFFALKGGAWFGRPALTAKEMAAIETGGASDL